MCRGWRCVNEPCSGNLERVGSSNDESIFYGSQDELGSGAKRDQARGLFIYFGEIHWGRRVAGKCVVALSKEIEL